MRKMKFRDIGKLKKLIENVGSTVYNAYTSGIDPKIRHQYVMCIATKGDRKGQFIYNWNDMKDILQHIEEGVDVSKYSLFDENDKPVYNRGMRHEIGKGLMSGVDVDKYMVLNDAGEPIYQHDEMKVIREGLEKGVDVDKFMGLNSDGEPIYDSWQMSIIKDCLSGRYTTDINEINGLDENDKPLYESCMMKAIIACDQAGVGTAEIKSYLLETDENGKRIFDDYRIVELLAVSTIAGVDTKTWAERYKKGMPFDEFISDYKGAIRKYGSQEMFDKIDLYNVSDFKTSRPSFLSMPTIKVKLEDVKKISHDKKVGNPEKVTRMGEEMRQNSDIFGKDLGE